MLDIPGICVDANSEEADRVQESNDKYEKVGEEWREEMQE